MGNRIVLCVDTEESIDDVSRVVESEEGLTAVEATTVEDAAEKLREKYC